MKYYVKKNNEIIKEYLSLNFPSGIDIDEKNSILYVADRDHITLLDLKLEFISSWKFSKEPPHTWSIFRGLKVDREILYLTIYGLHQIFLYTCQDGKILNEFGEVLSGWHAKQFNTPMGLTTDNKFVYICDCYNQRVQILSKQNGDFVSNWGGDKASTKEGQFDNPYSIYNHEAENVIYVGDNYSVQLFKKDGVCIQRLGDTRHGNEMNQFQWVYGLCAGGDNRLYCSDLSNKRIQIFKRCNEVSDPQRYNLLEWLHQQLKKKSKK